MNQHLLFQTERIKDYRSGKSQILLNIDVCFSIGSFLETTLGQYGLDKLFYGENKLILTNIGAIILQNMKSKHPVTKIMINLSMSQVKIVKDGTPSVVILAAVETINLR